MMVVGALSSVAGLLSVVFLALVIGRSSLGTRVVYSATLAGSVAVFAFAISTLFAGEQTAQSMTLPLGLPWLGAQFSMDPLAAFFLAVVNLGAGAASLYAIGYGRHETEPMRVLPFFPAFLAGMNLVVLAADAFTFLLSWEFMSLASWALVMAHHRTSGNARAGIVYIIMASLGALTLLLAFGLLAGPDGGYGFDAIREEMRSESSAALILCLALFGAGSKAGLVPLHIWLPLAHPAAPSHVSALMSGVMTKVAVYAVIRIVFDLLGTPAWWWGLTLLSVGAVTAVLGVLYAFLENDLKRILAYSTIENIGLIFIGLGLALAFEANQFPVAAAVALTAALFHVLNHSLFKSLLFFGAGAVLVATAERNLDRLGGLVHQMPVTAATFLVGCVAISALPPLNGFASEWLMLQVILLSPELPQWGLKLFVPAAGALLALSAALAGACFVRAFGITFLGRARSPVAEQAHDADRWSLGVMAGLSGLCLIAGMVPGAVIDGLSPVVQSITGARMPPQMTLPWLSIIPVAESRSSYNGLFIFLFIGISSSLIVFGIHRWASRASRRAAAWDCGFPDPSPVTQYTAGSFAQPIVRVFGTFIFRARERVEIPPPGDPRPAHFELQTRDLIWDSLYTPIVSVVAFLAEKLNYLQFLTIRRYLSLVFLSLVALLLVLALWPIS